MGLSQQQSVLDDARQKALEHNKNMYERKVMLSDALNSMEANCSVENYAACGRISAVVHRRANGVGCLVTDTDVSYTVTDCGTVGNPRYPKTYVVCKSIQKVVNYLTRAGDKNGN